MQTSLLIHFAITPDKTQTFQTCLLGTPTIRLRDKTTGIEWVGSTGSWYVESELTDAMGQRRACLADFAAWYCAAAYQIQNANGITNYMPPLRIESNCNLPLNVPDTGFDAFLAACNLERWPEGGGNMTSSI